MALGNKKHSAPKGIARAHRERKREEAEARQALANNRTVSEQIWRLDQAQMTATRERAKLAARA